MTVRELRRETLGQEASTVILDDQPQHVVRVGQSDRYVPRSSVLDDVREEAHAPPRRQAAPADAGRRSGRRAGARTRPARPPAGPPT